MPWSKGQSGNIKGNVKKGKYLPCNNCGKKLYTTPSRISKKYNRVFCSRKCSWKSSEKNKSISNSHKGKKLSDFTKWKLRKFRREKAHRWKGGKPRCKTCYKLISYKKIYCKKHWKRNMTNLHKRKISDSLYGKMPSNLQRAGKFGNIQRGWFDIGNKKIFFRSKWEANYALYLDFLKQNKEIKEWYFEKDIFVFEKIKSGTRTYKPDFKIINNNDSIEYHEVKGWFNPRSKTQIKRMAKYHPNIKLLIIDGDEYKDLKRKLGGVLKFY